MISTAQKEAYQSPLDFDFGEIKQMQLLTLKKTICINLMNNSGLGKKSKI